MKNEIIPIAKLGAAEQNVEFATIIVIEDDIPGKGHYYHNTTLASAIWHAQRAGCYAAKAYAYASERHTFSEADAVNIVAFGK